MAVVKSGINKIKVFQCFTKLSEEKRLLGIKVALKIYMMIEAADNILLCSQNPLLTKELYGPLRDSGCRVEISEHAAEAIKCILGKHYLAVILDSRDVGLNVIEAVTIIKSLSPDIYIFIIGEHDSTADVYSVKRPEDLERLVEFINNLPSLKARS